MNCAPMTRSSSVALAVALALALSITMGGTLGCGNRDQDRQRRFDWMQKQTADNKLYVRHFLSRPGEYEFGDGWYPVEADTKTGGSWRWMEKRAIIQLRTKPGGATEARDMELKLFGWVPYEHVGFRQLMMEFAVNGHVLDRFDPPKTSFEHSIIVPRALLEHGDWVDFVITVANTARPTGDWRDLGFGTSGFHWTPVGGS
jgi:hypothetical protein